MKRAKRFILYWIHNGILIYLANQIFPSKFVLGNFRLTLVIAVLVSSFALTLFLELVSFRLIKVKKIKFDNKKRFGLFWLANFIGLWLIARLAPLTGFGVVRFTWLIGLSFLVNVLQTIFPRK
ncbi:hypothetical protein KJ570_01765 [Patescibacteria group bacterium]|nr:hypothetical protein [Patescibacteria group bacterium]MBU2036147.1 hypothetical protein [Patescibacteria group bacterium]